MIPLNGRVSACSVVYSIKKVMLENSAILFYMAREETEVLEQIRDFLELKGFKVIRMNNGGSYHNGKFIRNLPVGCPDLFACGPHGEFCCVEVKKPGGKPSREQAAFIEEIRKLGGISLVAESLGQVVQALSVAAEVV